MKEQSKEHSFTFTSYWLIYLRDMIEYQIDECLITDQRYIEGTKLIEEIDQALNDNT